jgi:hypothetical protein
MHLAEDGESMTDFFKPEDFEDTVWYEAVEVSQRANRVLNERLGPEVITVAGHDPDVWYINNGEYKRSSIIRTARLAYVKEVTPCLHKIITIESHGKIFISSACQKCNARLKIQFEEDGI